MCCAPQQVNHLDPSAEEDPFERVEDEFDFDEWESDEELNEEKETILILEQEVVRLRNRIADRTETIRMFAFIAIVAITAVFAIVWFGPDPIPHSRAPAAECPKMSCDKAPSCPPAPACEVMKSEDLRLCPGEERVRVLMQSEDELHRRGFQVKDRVVTQIDRFLDGDLRVGHEIMFVDGVNVANKTDDELGSMLWNSSPTQQNSEEPRFLDMVVRKADKRVFDLIMELIMWLTVASAFCRVVLEPLVWARDKIAIEYYKKHSAKDNSTECPEITDREETVSVTIKAQNVAIEDNRVELEIYEARLATAKCELAILEETLKDLMEKTANAAEVEKAMVDDLLDKALNEFCPTNGEEQEEPKAGVITRSHRRLSRSNGVFLDAPSLLP